MNQTTLSDALLTKIRERLKSSKQPQIYWDYRDEISNETILKALEKEPDYPLNYIENEVFEYNDDLIYDIEIGHIKDTLEWFPDELRDELELNEDADVDYEEIAKDIRDELLGYIQVDYDLKYLLRNSVNIRIQLHSNYDCINSHWFEVSATGGYEYPESYFADTINALQLNPATVKKLLNKHGVKTHGRWVNRDDSQALISYEDFWIEEENRSTPACLLCVVATVNQYDLLIHGLKGKIIIPKGNNVGFYSSFQGGGSVFDAQLLHDMEIEPDKPLDESGYLTWSVVIDAKDEGYAMKEFYGVGNSFFGDDIKFVDEIK